MLSKCEALSEWNVVLKFCRDLVDVLDFCRVAFWFGATPPGGGEAYSRAAPLALTVAVYDDTS